MATKTKVKITPAPAAEKTTPYEELINVGGVAAPAKKETFALFAVRLCEAVAKISDDDFAKLSKPAQTWFNAAADAVNLGEAGYSQIPALEGFPGASAPAPAPAAKTKGQQQTLPGVPVQKTPTKNKKATDGLAHKMRTIVVKKPAISFEDAAAKVGVEAKVGSHAFNIWNECRQVMRIVTAAQQPA